MNLSDGIATFEDQGKGRFSKKDRALIVATADELGLVEFNLYVVPSKKYPQFIRDVDDVLHVHPTMMVSGQPCSGSTDRGTHPYPKHPHHLALAGWVFEKGKLGHPICPECNIEVPATGQCGYCEWNPSGVD